MEVTTGAGRSVSELLLKASQRRQTPRGRRWSWPIFPCGSQREYLERRHGARVFKATHGRLCPTPNGPAIVFLMRRNRSHTLANFGRREQGLGLVGSTRGLCL